MDLDYPPEAEAFRSEVRAWLDAHVPPGWDGGARLGADERRAFTRDWARQLVEGGWVGVAWPREYGGRGLSAMEQVVLNEEFTARRVPRAVDAFGESMVGPTIIQWGTDAQKAHWLPRILDGRDRWCQGFSEPEAGSDLASLATRAVLDGDEWVLTGQKVWTSSAARATMMFCLARTDPDVPKQAGITYFLVPMDQAGVTIRPLRQMTGAADFSEVFVDGARCPAENVVGGVANGWKVANTTLGYERGGTATTAWLGFRRELDAIVTAARRAGRADDPVLRQALARCYSDVRIMQFQGLRTLTAVLHGARPGPEASVAKLASSEYHRRATDLWMDVLGMEGTILAGASPEDADAHVVALGIDPGYPLDRRQYAFLWSRAETIYAGSSEIQRNIVGERVLGLPREPRGERRTWAEERAGRRPAGVR